MSNGGGNLWNWGAEMSRRTIKEALANTGRHDFCAGPRIDYEWYLDTAPEAETPASSTGQNEKDIVGLKYFDPLVPLLKRLRDDGCVRNKAGNRELHFGQFAARMRRDLFPPICSSLLVVQQASELLNVQSRLGCGRAALGSLSEASTIFDPERGVEIIPELGGQLQPLVKDSRLKDVR